MIDPIGDHGRMLRVMRVAAVSLVLMLALFACAHAPNVPFRPETPAPAGEEVGSFQAADGTQLFRRKWPATSAPQKGVLIIQHGLNDHSDNYDHLARRAAAAGFAVYAADLRGHARSAGPRVAPRDWQDYVDDLDRFIGLVHLAEPGQPIFIMGHSMGGAIVAATVVERQPPGIAGVILSGAALNLGVPPIGVAGVRLLGVIAPNLGALDLKPEDFSSDPAVVAAMKKDPLVELGPNPARTAAGLAAGAASFWAHIDRLTMPVLALHGTKDLLTAPSGSRALIEAAPATDKTLRIYEGFKHDLVHEPDGTRVEDDILAWLAAHTGGPAVKPPPIFTGPLRGDPSGTVLGIELGGGLGLVSSGGTTSKSGLGELRVHFGKRVPIGLGGAARATITSDGFAGALMPIGIGVRLGGAMLGVAGGISTIPDGLHAAVPVGAWLELPLGPFHATIDAQLDYRIAGDPARAAALSSDLAQAGIALRLPGDRTYWPRAHAGVGPYLRGGVIDAGGSDPAYAITLGLELYGAD